MKTNNLLLNYVNQSRPRERGRYYASELYQIIKGYLKPQDFFKTKPIDIIGAQNICRGEAFESQWKKILEVNKIPFKYGDEIKREIKIGEITLVVKPDFEMKNWVLETKFPVNEITEIPDKWLYQLEAEYRATKKQVYLGVFSNVFQIDYYKFEPSLARWKLIEKKLKEFHSMVPKIQD